VVDLWTDLLDCLDLRAQDDCCDFATPERSHSAHQVQLESHILALQE
jgi:hypothetical protein